MPDQSGDTKYVPKHKLLPLRDRPVERVSASPTICTTGELLAALLGGPRPIETAEALLAQFKGDLHELQRAQVHEIAGVPGIGLQNAARLKAALELGIRLLQNHQSKERPTVHSPADTAALVQYEMSILEQEHLRTILLLTRAKAGAARLRLSKRLCCLPASRVIEIVEVYHGNLNSAQVRVAEVFREAIRRNAAPLIVCHNFPSGCGWAIGVADCLKRNAKRFARSVSPDDVAVTRAIVQAGKLLDLDVLDHLILTRTRYVSLKERGLGFEARLSEQREPYLHRSPFTLQENDESQSDSFKRTAEPFADDLIYAYTRAQALADGVLVDTSEMAREAGFKFPTAISTDLHARLEPNKAEKAWGQSYEGRLWDVLWMASLGARKAGRTDRVSFQVILAEVDERHPRKTRQNTLTLWCVIGPGDQGEPVITIGFPQDF
jgi:DNA repair protein RadC